MKPKARGLTRERNSWCAKSEVKEQKRYTSDKSDKTSDCQRFPKWNFAAQKFSPASRVKEFFCYHSGLSLGRAASVLLS